MAKNSGMAIHCFKANILIKYLLDLLLFVWLLAICAYTHSAWQFNLNLSINSQKYFLCH